MDDRDAELLAKLLPTFREEAEEHLRRIDVLLAGLVKEYAPAAVEEVFREVHSLKGAARAVGARELEALCQEMETVFARVKRGELRLERPLLDLLLLAADLAAKMARGAGRETPADLGTLLARAVSRLREAAQGRTPAFPAEPAAAPSAPPPPPPELDTLRVGAERMERVLVQAEELLTDKLGARRRVESLREVLARVNALRRNLAAAADEARMLQRVQRAPDVEQEPGTEATLPHLRDLLGVAAETAGALEVQGRQCLREAEEHSRSLAAKVEILLESVRETLQLPVANLLEQLPRIVRELARESGKSAHLETSGGDILVDRRVLEALRDPLLHLLRNAIDHGIESPEERQRRGKPERGRLRLEVTSPAPRRVLLTLTDDGRGLDPEKLREAAIRDGLVTPETAAALDDERAVDLAFASGVSTRERVTSVSGRGLGLPIVRDRVERLGGAIHVASRNGEGTTFSLELPAALASFRGVLTRLGEALYIFPAMDVERILRLRQEQLAVVKNRDVLEVDGAPLPLVRLEQPLSLPLPRHGDEAMPAVITRSRSGRIAFAVDEVLGEQEFLVKALGKQLLKPENFSGAAILQDGGIALILDPEDLAHNAAGAAPIHAVAAALAQPARRRVLVVEDSITARTLLRHILEGAGYAVATAVDGVDALDRLAAAVFDVVVSDVQMPRMDGFRLTQRIRENYGRLPVILVTGLESEDDRERGIMVGADAYIVKSRFDQGNLLEVIGRLT